MPAGETTTILLDVTVDVRLVDGAFRLALAPVAAGCGREEAVVPKDATLAASVRVHHGGLLRSIDSPTHPIIVDELPRDVAEVQLPPGMPLDGEGLVIAITMGRDAEAEAAGWVLPHADGDGELVLVLTPPAIPPEDAIRAKDVVIVLDTSGSMGGPKITEARQAVASVLEALRPDDAFGLVEFDSTASAFRPKVEPASPSALDEAAAWLEAQVSAGGTRLVPALELALGLPREASRHRLLAVLTDGAIAAEQAVRALLAARLGDAGFLFVGIGGDAHSETIRALAEYGRGAAVFPSADDDLVEAVTRLVGSFGAPVAWNVSLDWGAARVERVRPERLPDLYAGRPVTVHAFVRGAAPTEVGVRATTMLGEDSFNETVPLTFLRR